MKKGKIVLVTIPACLHQHDPHLLYTLSAIQVAVILDRLDMLDLERIEDFICGLQQDDGSFVGDAWKEVDTRFSFCAVAALSLMGKLETADIDLDKAVSFVESCMNFDGGFGTRPGSESHAGQIYCCVGFLSITGMRTKQESSLFDYLNQVSNKPARKAPIPFDFLGER